MAEIGSVSGWVNGLMRRITELREEFLSIFSGRGARILDSFLPLLLFLLLFAFVSLEASLWGAIGAAIIIAALRIFQRESLVYALGGLGGVLLAAVFVHLGGSGAGFFIPGLISGAVTVVLCVISVAINRPLVAWTSFVARRWPLNWYWHPGVLPAYNEVTMGWGVVFALRLSLEWWLYQQGAVETLGALRIFLGWPFTIILLILSYLYGLWRLRKLKGPSVEEFKAGAEPPWAGQRRGF